MPARERLSALDAAFLDLDTPAAPLHIGWTMRLSGSAPTLAALRRHLETRLDRVPRFRRCLAGPALGAGAATWSDDPGFDIARHVQAMTLAAPGGPAELRALAGRLLSVPLDGGRPLWRITLVDGLRPTPGESPDEGAFALVGQVHHALVDAVAALEVAALLLFDDQSRPVSAHSGPAPAGRRSPAVRRPLVAQALEALGAVARPAPATSLDRTAGPERVVAFAETRLEAMRSAARGAGDAITVNDVLLAAVTVALGAALRRRGEHPVALKALVPVDVRAGRDRGLGNAISFLFVDLPVCESDPQRALATITARTSVAKRTGELRPAAPSRAPPTRFPQPDGGRSYACWRVPRPSTSWSQTSRGRNGRWSCWDGRSRRCSPPCPSWTGTR